MNLYIVNVIIPATKKGAAQRTLQVKLTATDDRTAKRLAVTKCPQAEGTLAYGEIVKCFAPLAAKVGDSRPSTVAPVVARRARRPRPEEGGRRPRKNVAPMVAKRIPACPGRAFSPDEMSFGEAMVTTVAEDSGWVDAIRQRAAKVSAEVKASIAADVDAEMNPTTESNFLVGVGQASDVDGEGWTGWRVGTR